MEISFQNKKEYFEAFYDYMLKHTKEGKRIGHEALEFRLSTIFLLLTMICAILWGITRNYVFSSIIWLSVAIAIEATLLIARSKLRFFSGKQIYKSQEKYLEPRDIQRFQIPRKITLGDEWLEIRSQIASHSYKWSQVDNIGLTDDFIFIHVGTCPVVYVPRRDFPSTEAYLDFGNQMMQLREKARKDLPG